MVAAAASLSAFPHEAAADEPPPPGYDWILSSGELVIVNTSSFPDWVFVAYPCFPNDSATDKHCVVREGERLSDPRGALLAIPSRVVRTQESAPLRLPGRQPRLLLSEPRFSDEAHFFETDSRLVRPAHSLSADFLSIVPQNLGLRYASYFVRVESVGPEGVKARLTKARYTCPDGVDVEVDWGPDQKIPPVPHCPVADDHAQMIGEIDGGVRWPGATAPAAPRGEPARPLARPMIWAGLSLVSASLLGLGLLLRKAPDR